MTVHCQQNGDTPLHYASMHGNYEIVQILLEANCSIDKRREGDGATALALAANGNHTQSLTLLLDSGADINSRLSGNEGKHEWPMWVCMHMLTAYLIVVQLRLC